MRQYEHGPGASGDKPPAAVLDRLAASFGAAPIRDLCERFATMLTDALAALERGEAQETAHRVAGLAGTLGFAAAGRAWLALAEGDEQARETIVRESRQAIATIALWTRNHQAPATSV